MSKLTAKNVSDTFWIVQHNGRKVGNITVNAQGVVLQTPNGTKQFQKLKDIEHDFDIEWQEITVTKPEKSCDVFGYPTRNPAHNPEFDVHRRLPLFTSDADSKSKMSAGYYLVNKQGWKRMFCPKLITLDRYSYYGPYMNKQDLLARHQIIQNDPLYQTAQ